MEGSPYIIPDLKIIPEVSVLTSCQQGWTACQIMRQLVDRGHFVFDLYCLSEPDAVALTGHSLSENPSGIDSCTNLLASTDPAVFVHYLHQCWSICHREPEDNWSRPLTPIQIHERIHEKAPRRPFTEDGIRIASIASYIPNLSHPHEAVRQVAKQALLNLAIIANFLGATCVELVGGPRFTCSTAGTISFETGHVRDRQEALARSLHEVAIDRKMPPNVGLAVELEPGPVSLLRDLHSVKTVLNLADQYNGGRLENVGLNVDIAHYSSVFCDNDEVPGTMRETSVMTRVMHFHCSDLRRPHFNDVVFPLWRPHQYFAHWTRYFLDLWRDPMASRFFTGVMAVELESVESLDDVVTAVHTMRGWIGNGLHNMQYKPVPRTRLSAWPLHFRPHSTIVIADLVGSTPLVTEIEERQTDTSNSATLWGAFIMHIASALQRSNGRLLQFTGDGFVAVFFPVVLEEAAADLQEDCVGRALQFLESTSGEIFNFAKELKIKDWRFQGMRVGISSGATHFGTIFPGEEEQTTVFGPTIIRAARLMALATHGGIYTDDLTHNASPNIYKGRFKKFKMVTLKGLKTEDKQQVWSYQGLTSVPPRRRSHRSSSGQHISTATKRKAHNQRRSKSTT